MAEDERNPIDDLVDLLLYAPVGLLYEYDEVLPKLIRRGKSQVQLARVLGTMAVNNRGSAPANAVIEAVASMLAERVTEIGASIGLAPPRSDKADADPMPKSSGSSATPTDPATASSADPETDERPLPIASYDGLTAREVIALLDELDPGQLARIRAHEEANRARKTVLGKLDRLSS